MLISVEVTACSAVAVGSSSTTSGAGAYCDEAHDAATITVADLVALLPHCVA